jgi:hypothetical protein
VATVHLARLQADDQKHQHTQPGAQHNVQGRIPHKEKKSKSATKWKSAEKEEGVNETYWQRVPEKPKWQMQVTLMVGKCSEQ